jgi:hypothetical protein
MERENKEENTQKKKGKMDFEEKERKKKTRLWRRQTGGGRDKTLLMAF